MIEITKETINRIDEILSRGLSNGIGNRDGQMCVEAAICYALGEPHSDKPSCVDLAIRTYKIKLNDSHGWKTPESRAVGLRDLAIAQLGSKSVVNPQEFSTRLAEKTIRILIPKLFRELFPGNVDYLKAADYCERVGTGTSAKAARDAADACEAAAWAATRAAAWAAARAATWTATWAAEAATAWAVTWATTANAAAWAAAWADAADAAAWAADAARSADPEEYLRLSAKLALETLKELGSPGCAWL